MVASRWVWGLLGSAILILGNTSTAAQERPQTPMLLADTAQQTEADILFGEGMVLYESETAAGSQQALNKWGAALVFYEQQQNAQKVALTSAWIGFAHSELGDKQEALGYYEKSLAIYQKLGDRRGEAGNLHNIGRVYADLGENQQALDYFQRALSLRQELGEGGGAANILNNTGLVYADLGEKQQALDYFQQALPLFQGVGDRHGEASTVNNIARIYSSLGETEYALDYFQQALLLAWAVGDRRGGSTALTNIGGVYFELGDQELALNYYQEALRIKQEVGDRHGEANILNNLGWIHSASGETQSALDYYQQALSLWQAVGDRRGEGTTLSNIGLIYAALDEKEQALDYYQQALSLKRAVGDRPGEAKTLDYLGSLFQASEQPEIAIIFHKQSVNLYEDLRNEIQGFPLDIQQTYTDSIAETYRRLADALLAQDRILEAQRVLDLLKVQELNDYLNNIRGNADTESGIANRGAETIIINGYNVLLDDAIQVGQTLAELSQIAPGDRTPEQRQQIRTLRQAKETIIIEMSDFFASESVQAELVKLQRNTGGENFDLDLYAKNLKDDLAQFDNAVILYPLVLGDRLELIVISATAPPFRRTVPISRITLNKTILEYRNALTRPQLRHNINVIQATSKKLYDLLIAPLAEDLKQLGTENIIYAPDGQLRYVPLAALYDGEQWLIENYNINNITAVSLTNFSDKPSGELSILAGAFTDAKSSVAVGTRNFTFEALPYAKSEVETLATTIATTTTRFDDDFSADIRFEVEDYNIVHLATHAQFVGGTPEESFILFNNQQKQTLKDVEKWDLTNVDLLVLSACQTALGDELGNGQEILGLGFQMQRAGAKSTIASLWYVDDGGTKVLMDNFYSVLASQPDITKAEALRKAQVSLIQNVDPVTGEIADNSLNKTLTHPYYWSAFILIGNGL
jgi:CHAT domain-containing protein/Tfp pilus assembly protein PilF